MEVTKIIFGFVVAAIIFIPLERLLPYHRDQPVFRPGWKTDLKHFVFNRLWVSAGLILTVGSLLALFENIVSDDVQTRIASLPWFVQFFMAVIISDFLSYWTHRFAHRIGKLWEFHKIHHSSEQMDWLAAVRVHPVDTILIRSVQFVPLYLLGFSKETFGAYAGFLGLYAIFIHSNIRFSLGPFRYAFTSPEFHHWHHASEPKEALNKNFAGQLPLWDWLFGTLYLPKGKKPEGYGIDEPLDTAYLKHLWEPFRSILGDANVDVTEPSLDPAGPSTRSPRT